MFYLTKRDSVGKFTYFGIKMEQAVYHPPEDEAAWIWLGAGLACLAAAVFGELLAPPAAPCGGDRCCLSLPAAVSC